MSSEASSRQSNERAALEQRIAARTQQLKAQALDEQRRSIDRMFFWVLLGQWAFGVLLAATVTPYAESSRAAALHLPMQVAIGFGGLVTSLPLLLIHLRPGWLGTRVSVAISQMLWSGILIHLTGGRIETHFHVFGSLAFIALYLDWKTLVPATLTVALDHIVRGAFFPESVFGTIHPEWWRVWEHVGWVAFEDVVLFYGCFNAVKLNRKLAEREARLEMAHSDVEQQVVERTRQLEAEVQERRARERDLQAARIAAEAASKAKSEFLANMSHEIRTPMNGILGFTNLLMETQLDHEQREQVQTIRQSGETLLTIINDILDFSKVEAGKLTVESLPFDLRRSAEQVVELLAPQAAAKGLELVLHVSNDVPESVLGDAGRVRQVLLNLAGNAIKFTRKGHVLVEVEVLRALHTGGADVVRACVTDTGIGIPAEKQSLLFREFTQADASTTREFGGTGLGLAISRKLVELMGGKVDFSSESGVGSKFWFTLPAPPASAVPVVPLITPSMPEMADMRVLIVDDLAVNRTLMSKQLDSWGIRHEVVSSGERALEVLERARCENRPFDIALLDHLMPEMDGLELCHRIKGDPDLARTSLVMATSGSQRSEADTFLLAGFSVFLQKPIVRPSQLFDALIQAWQAHPDRLAEAQRPPIEEEECTGSGGMTFGIPQDRANDTIREQIAARTVAGNPELVAAGRSATHPEPANSKSAPLFRVLVAEDNNVNQRLVIRMIEKLGGRADLAHDGREAVAMSEASHYDAILMDCFMPEMDGYAATAAIRGREAASLGERVPIIALTANALPADREKCLAAGMDDYLSKPVRREDIEAALERWNVLKKDAPPTAASA